MAIPLTCVFKVFALPQVFEKEWRKARTLPHFPFFKFFKEIYFLDSHITFWLFIISYIYYQIQINSNDILDRF